MARKLYVGNLPYNTTEQDLQDLFAGAGALNYGHNDPAMREALVDYLVGDNIVHSLDAMTVARHRFLEAFEEVVLAPRGLDWKVQFPGPTGTNAVEAAMKLARKVTGREPVVGFTNAFHGMTLGSLAVSGNSMKRDGAGVSLTSGINVPYDGYFGDGVDTISHLDALLADTGSGFEKPAAVIVETVQAEGGLGTASVEWLQRLRRLCTDHEVLLIVDDIQAGCGRTGPFFSFEEAGLSPDIITLSKSLSGYGLPFSLVLMKPELDQWKPGEHNGTFRGHNLAFVTAKAALDEYWQDDYLATDVKRKGHLVRAALSEIAERAPSGEFSVRGRGMMQGLDCGSGALATRVSAKAFEKGLLIERSGAEGQVMKCLSPLTISDDELIEGLGLLKESVRVALDEAAAEPSDVVGARK